jgi:tetratricopeptide (TPR) repeat protein
MAHADRLYAVGLFRALGGENRALLLHLLECSRCRLRLQTDLLPPADDSPPPQVSAVTEAVLDHALARQQDRDQEEKRDFEEAALLCEELTALPPESWEGLVDSDRRFQTLGVARRLAAAAEESADSPRRSERLASLALSVAERLPAAWIDSDLAADVRARAWCWNGEARRLLGDPAGAEEAFQRAVHHLVPEPLTTSARALLCRMLARHRYVQERSDEALGLIGRAIARLEELRDFSGLAEALADQGWFLLEETETEAALSALAGALALVDSRRRPRTELRIRHGLAFCYCELGQAAKAHKVAAGEPLRPYLTEPVDRTRLTWIAAEVYERSGDLRRAIRGLELVFNTLIDLAAFPDAALAALQLARCHAEERRIEVMAELRRRIESLREQQRIPEMPATLLSFVLAAEPGARGLLDRAAEYLERARHNPALEFHPRDTPSSELFWDTLDRPLRERACEAAKVCGDAAIRPAVEVPIQIRHRISWTFEESTGIRIVFSD